MQTLLGNTSFRLKDFLKASDDWQTSTESGVNISVQKEWDISNPLKIDHIIYRYSGGSNGRIIAQHERSFVECLKHVITLYDHKFNTLGECVVNEKCRNIFIYVSSTDELRVVTSSGRLFIFQGETVISNLPILSPELEPQANDQDDQETQQPKRNREIIDVAFWETGFVYIDRDGFIVEYQLDNSSIQVFDQTNNSYSHNYNESESDKYVSNVESTYNMHTKVISTKLESIGIPICFDVIPPNYTGLSNGSPYVFIAGSTNSLYIVYDGGSSKIEMPASIISISFSASYKFISIIVDPMILLIMPVTLDFLYLRLEIDEGDVFEQLSWVGDDIPIIAFNEICLLILQNSETISIPTKSNSLIIKQSNSALILSNNALYRTSFISESVGRCFGAVKSKDEETPALKLIRSFCSYSHDQVLNMKKEGELEKAIKDCVEAAQQIQCDISNDTDKPDNQTILMMSACFGRSYTYTNIDNDKNSDDQSGFNNVDTEMTEEFLKAVKWIRLANFFRKKLNISVSPKELRENCTVDEVIARICNRGLFSPAFEVADEFGGDKSSVVTRWCTKIIEKVKDDQFCYKCLIHMKKSLTKSEIKTNSPSIQSPLLTSLKIKKKTDDFGQNDTSELDEDRFTCVLFDTASISSNCLIRGRPKLASKIANNELNSNLVIPFFAASGLWKEALLAAASTWDSNIFIEVLKKSVFQTNQSVIVKAIENSYFAYSTTTKLSFCWRKKMIEDSSKKDDDENKNKRTRSRSRSVNKTDIEICSSIIDNEYFSRSVNHMVKKEPTNKKVLDLFVKNKLRLLTAEIDINQNSDNFDLVKKTDEDLKKICIDHPSVQWASNQAELTTLETKLINLYSKLIKVVDSEKKGIDLTNLKLLKFNELTVNKLIRTAADSHCLSRLIELAKSEGFDEITPKMAVAVAANYIARKGDFDLFKSLFAKVEQPFYSLLKLSSTIALHFFGKDKATEFVKAAPDGKDKQTALNWLSSASQINADMSNPAFAMPFDVYGTNAISIDFFKVSLMGR